MVVVDGARAAARAASAAARASGQLVRFHEPLSHPSLTAVILAEG